MKMETKKATQLQLKPKRPTLDNLHLTSPHQCRNFPVRPDGADDRRLDPLRNAAILGEQSFDV